MNWKLFVAVPIMAGMFATYAWAAPSFKKSGSTFTVTESFTDDVAKQMQEAVGGALPDNATVSLRKPTSNEELAKLCAAYPNMTNLSVNDAPKITDLSPLAKLSKLKGIKISNAAATDMAPLSDLTELQNLEVEAAYTDLKWMSKLTKLKTITLSSKPLRDLTGIPSLPNLRNIYIGGASPADLTPMVTALPSLEKVRLTSCTIADLTPLTKLSKVKEVDLYGATVKDFTPLSQIPTLQKVTYYAVKDGDFATLGTLKQVKTLDGGLTKLDNITWLKDLPNLKEFDVFAEYVTDYGPLAGTNIEKFKIWNMRAPIDLTAVGKMSALKDLTLLSVEKCSNSALLLNPKLEKLEVNGYNEKGGEAFSCAGAKAWTQLKELNVQRTKLADTAALTALKDVRRLQIHKSSTADGKPLDLSFLKGMTALESIEIIETPVQNLEALAGHPSLKYLTIKKVPDLKGVSSLKSAGKLERLTVPKDLPEAETQGFDQKVKISRQ